MRIGIFSEWRASLQEMVQRVVDAEEDGFDSFWFGQAFFVDALSVIALAGHQTHRIELGTAVVPTYSRHPFAMAQQALTAQAATSGRFTLGIGPSHKAMIEDMWGLSFHQPARRVREYLAVLRSLVYEGRVSFQGEFFRVNASLRVPGAEPFPILISALGPMMLRIAGELADGTITWVTGRKTIETHIVPRINAAAEAAGRPRPRVCVALPVVVTDNVAVGRESVARVFQIYGQFPSYRRVLDREGVSAPEDVAVIGNESQVERQLGALADAGATDFIAVMIAASDDPAASLARTHACLKGLLAAEPSA